MSLARPPRGGRGGAGVEKKNAPTPQRRVPMCIEVFNMLFFLPNFVQKKPKCTERQLCQATRGKKWLCTGPQPSLCLLYPPTHSPKGLQRKFTPSPTPHEFSWILVHPCPLGRLGNPKINNDLCGWRGVARIVSASNKKEGWKGQGVARVLWWAGTEVCTIQERDRRRRPRKAVPRRLMWVGRCAARGHETPLGWRRGKAAALQGKAIRE